MTDSPDVTKPEQDSPHSTKGALILLAILSGIYLVSVFFYPPDGNYFSICGFKNFTGLPCPACGLTHSFCAIAKGDFLDAFSYNLLGPPLFLFSIFFWFRSLAVLLGWNDHVSAFDSLMIRVRPARRFLAAFLVFGISRITFLLVFADGAVKSAPLAKLWLWLIG